MATKTISLNLEAYERLRAARRTPDESFTQVILRATWPETTAAGAALLAHYRRHGPFLSEEGIKRIERLKVEAQPAEDNRG